MWSESRAGGEAGVQEGGRGGPGVSGVSSGCLHCAINYLYFEKPGYFCSEKVH